MVPAVMSLYDNANTGLRWDLRFQRNSKLGWCRFRICTVATIVCNSCGIVTENARRGVVDELLFADDLVQ